MRVLLCSLYFYPDVTSTCKYSTEMARWFVERGHEVDVIVGFPFYPAWKLSSAYPTVRYLRESIDGVRVHRVPHYVPRDGRVTSLRRVMMDVTFFLSSFPVWVRLAFSKQRPDVMIAVCPPLFTAIPAWIVGALRRIPWIFHIQDFQVDAAMRLGMLKLGPLGGVLYRLENFLIRRATRVASITPAMCRRAIAKGAAKDRTWLLPNWANVRSIMPGSRDNAFRRALPLGSAEFLACYAGAMGAKQGLDVVLDAAASLLGDSRFHFLMVGGGPEWQRLRDLANTRHLHNMSFLPVQPSEVLADLLRAADVHLVIQRAEAADLVMPSKLTNILSAGRPAIATAEPGTALSDVLDGHRCGIVIPPDDPSALALALKQLADQPDARAEMGVAARRYAEQYLDVDVILATFAQQLTNAFVPGVGGGKADD